MGLMIAVIILGCLLLAAIVSIAYSTEKNDGLYYVAGVFLTASIFGLLCVSTYCIVKIIVMFVSGLL